MRSVTKYIIFCLLTIILPVQAQDIKEIDCNMGLSDNSVNCIEQDSLGFIWMGTANGLSVYDGLRFHTYRNKRNNPHSLINNNIHRLLAVDGGVYISTGDGVDFYSFADGYFHHCFTNGKPIEGRVASFACIDGRAICVSESGRMFELRHDQAIPIKTSQNIFVFRPIDGRLFAVSNNSVCLLTPDGRQLAKLDIQTDASFKTNLSYSRITGLVYMGNGFGKPSKAFRVLGQRIEEVEIDLPSNLCCAVDYNGQVVFGTDGMGALVNGKRMEGLKGDVVFSLYVDRQDNLWVGHYRAGAAFCSSVYQTKRIIGTEVTTAVVTHNGRLYIGLDGGGLCVLDKHTGLQHTYTTENSALAGNNVIAMTTDDKHLWMAVYNKGVVSYDYEKETFLLTELPRKSTTGDLVWVICDDNNGHIWAGGNDVYVIDKHTGKASLVNSLTGVGTSSICYQDNYMWISTGNGLYKVDIRTKKIVRHYLKELPNNYIRYMKADSKGRLWLSFSDDDLCCFDPKTGNFSHYGSKEGLTCIQVNTILDCGDGRLLMGTGNGLFCLMENSGLFLRLGEDYNLPSTYTWGASQLDGQMAYFGTPNGLLCLDISKTGTTTSIYNEVSFSRLTLTNGLTYNLAGSHPQRIVLAHDENFFTIGFSVPEFLHPRQVRFRYYLKGLENDWREMTAEREVDYTNIPPGSYELFVSYLGSDGLWATPSVLQLTISPPWYLTLWAKIIWTLLALSAIYAAIRFYHYELAIKHQVELAEIEKESERRLNDAKMDFYTSITHELRTPLFLITAQLEGIMDGAKDIIKVPNTYLASVHRNAIRLNELISRVIDFRKLGMENLQLNLQRNDVAGFCRKMTSNYVDMFRQKGIEYQFKTDVGELLLDYDSLKLELIISNLITNAFKYTKNGGRVVMTLKDESDRVVFIIKDNGIGIDPKVKDTIFESFFRSERGKKFSKGDGLGLSYVKKLVELHGGQISVDSEMGKGSTFTFFIPKQEVASSIQPIIVDEPLHNANPMVTHTLLIIDDEHETIELLERNLEQDFRIEKAYDGVEGLKKAVETLPDIIICDMMMPRMDGIELLKRVKADKKLQHIKVIIFTAEMSEDNMMEAFDCGADAYLTKPISLKLLRKRIERLIEQPDYTGLMASVPQPDKAEKKQEKKHLSKAEQIFLLRCRELIDNNLSNPDFNIDFMTENLAMSHSALYKKVKTITGMSLIDFINDYKIFKAVQLFRKGETNIESVAVQCGISDPKHFRTLFRRKMGVTPKQFVQSL